MRAAARLTGAFLALAAIVVAAPVPLPALGVTPAATFQPTGLERIAPGVSRGWGTMTPDPDAGAQAVSFVSVTPGNPGIGFRAVLSGSAAVGRATVSEMAASISTGTARPVAAVNADAWGDGDGPTFDAPNGTHVQDGELMVAGSRRRGTLGVDADGTVHLGDPAIDITLRLPSGAGVPIARLDQRRRPGELVLYGDRFDARTGTDATGSEVTLSAAGLPLGVSGSWQARVVSVAPGRGDSPIPHGGLVLSGTGAAAALLDALAPGEPLAIEITIDAGWEAIREAVGGRQVLVRDGVALPGTGTDATSESPRTAIGLTADGRVLLVTVDGRQPGWSDGLDIDSLGQLLLSLGAVDALNMDGGGSATLVVRRPGDALPTKVNRASDARERPVTNALAVVSTIPLGPPRALAIKAPERLAVGHAAGLIAVAIDAGGAPVATLAAPVEWSTVGDGGTIDPGGELRAARPGSVSVIAHAGSLLGLTTVTTLTDERPPNPRAPGIVFADGPAPPGDTYPAWVSWAAAVDGGVGVARYVVQRRDDGAAWQPLAVTSSDVRSVPIELIDGATTQVRLRAIDAAGNVSPWRTADPIRPRRVPATDRALRYAGTWLAEPPLHADGETWMSTAEADASVTWRGLAEAVAVVGTRGPGQGGMEVLVDGKLAETLDQFGTAQTGPRVVDQHTADGRTPVSLELRAVATPGRSRIRLVALLILEPAP